MHVFLDRKGPRNRERKPHGPVKDMITVYYLLEIIPQHDWEFLIPGASASCCSLHRCLQKNQFFIVRIYA